MADFVAAGEGGILSSEDGQTWSKGQGGIYSFAVDYSPELEQFFAAYNDGVSSPDGVTWTLEPDYPGSQVQGLRWISDLGLWVSSGGPFSTSPDGVNWTEDWSAGPHVSGLRQKIWDFAWSPELQLLVAVSSSYIFTSPDTVTWTQVSNVFGGGLEGVIWCPELGVFASVGRTYLYTSPDGANWTYSQPLGTSLNGKSVHLRDIAWSPELSLFVIVGSNTHIATSPDLVAWTPRTNPYGGQYDHFWTVAWSAAHSFFMMGGAAGGAAIATSPDGVTWTPINGLPAYSGAVIDLVIRPSAPPIVAGPLGSRRRFM